METTESEKNPIRSFYNREEEKTFSPETVRPTIQNGSVSDIPDVFFPSRCFKVRSHFIFVRSATLSGHMTAGVSAGGGLKQQLADEVENRPNTLKVSFQTDEGKMFGSVWS